MEIQHNAIDLHSHYNSKLGGNPESPLYSAQLPRLRELGLAAGIRAACFSSFPSVLSSTAVLEENLRTRKLCQTLDWAFQWVVVEPRIPETYAQAEEMLEDPKCVGIKIHPPYHGYSILDYADSIFSFAEKHSATVLMHPDHIEEMPRFADRYPGMRLIIAHLGSIEHVDAIAAAKYGNIYTDTSGGASTNNQILEYAVGRVGSDHIFFGTDTYSPAFQRGRIDYALIGEEDKKKILYQNALDLFPKLRGRREESQ